MTSIIQSNRERKSRIDEGLVERLNNAKEHKSNTSNKTQENKQSSSELRFITDKKEYDEIIKYMDSEFPEYKKIFTDNLKYENGLMKGSNTYIALAVNRYLRGIDADYRIATLAQLEKNLEFVKGCFVDTGFAIRRLTGYKPIDEIQDNTARSLFMEMKKDHITKKSLPLWIDLIDVHLNNDITVTTFTEKIYRRSESLNWPDEKHYSEIDEYGLPVKPDEAGLRTLYTSKDAIDRCVLSKQSNLFTSYFNFSMSTEEHRIVLAKK